MRFNPSCLGKGPSLGLFGELIPAVIGDVYCGYQIPEYTTYSEVLSVFKRLLPIPTALDAQDDYKLNITELKKAAKILSLSVIVASNPRNPTGQVIQGDDLKELVRMGDGNTTCVAGDSSLADSAASSLTSSTAGTVTTMTLRCWESPSRAQST